MLPVPASERAITEQAAELLEAGHPVDHLIKVARWMGAKRWRDLGYALTAKDAPVAAADTRSAGSVPGPRCGDERHDPESPESDRWLYNEAGQGISLCPCARTVEVA